MVDEALLTLAAPRFPVAGQAVVAAVEAGFVGDLVRGAVVHRLAPVLVEVLAAEGIDVPADLGERVSADRVLRLRSMSFLARIASSLDGAGLQWAAFKGPVVASFMTRPELRRFNDLDILVRGSDLGAAIDALRGVGAEELNRNWDGYVAHRVGEVPMTAGVVNIDLHWQIVGLGVHRRTMSLDPVAMLHRCRRRLVGQVDVSIFGPEDQLLHIALHSALSGAQRLDQLRDIAVLCQADEVDWSVLGELARNAGVARLVSHAIDRSRVVVGADVSAEFLRELGGRPLALRRRLDKWSRRPVSHQMALTVNLWRDDCPATFRTLSWQIGSRLRSHLGRGVGWDVGDVGGPLYYARESGGEAKRTAFLRGAAEWE